MKDAYQRLNDSVKKSFSEEGLWMFGVHAIVADNDDSEKQHRIRCLIPSIDEDFIYDEWVRPFVFNLGNGYGSFFLPPKGAEVVLFGYLGQKHNLYYASLYSEEMLVPPDFEDETTAGFRAPGDFKLITELDFQIRGGRIEIEADSVINIIAPGGLFVNGRRF